QTRPRKLEAGGRKPTSMRNVVKFVALQLLRAYKWAISPLFPPSCRYVPTCSEYAMEAVERFGVIRGSAMAIARLARCHPFSRGGHDPVVKHNHAAGSEQLTTNDEHPSTPVPSTI